MSIFRDFFNVKQKPVFTGSRFGFGSGGGPTGPSFSITGGNVADGVAPGNGYIYHVFSSSGALTVSGGEATGCEWLLIGGGAAGGGGDHYSGGGGAGGVVYKQNQDLTPGTYPVYIGSHGPGTPNQQDGNPSFPSHNRVNTGQSGGEDSEFTIGGSTIYALGGGRGGCRAQPGGEPNGFSGGCGGGGGVGYPGGPYPTGSAGSTSQPGQNAGIPNLSQYGNPGGTGPGPAQYGGNGGSPTPAGQSFAMSYTPNPSSVLISGSPVSPYTFAIGGRGYNNPSGSPAAAPATSFGSGGGGTLNQTPSGAGSPGVLILMYPSG